MKILQWNTAFLVSKIRNQTTGHDWFKVYISQAHPVIGFIKKL